MRHFWKRLRAVGAVASLVVVGGPVAAPPAALAAANTTAWQNGRFVVDTPNVVRRSNIVLGRANTAASEFVPLGNGTLGVAAWAANGFTAQLNRNDTFPDRKSPGWVTIPASAGSPAPPTSRASSICTTERCTSPVTE